MEDRNRSDICALVDVAFLFGKGLVLSSHVEKFFLKYKELCSIYRKAIAFTCLEKPITIKNKKIYHYNINSILNSKKSPEEIDKELMSLFSTVDNLQALEKNHPLFKLLNFFYGVESRDVVLNSDSLRQDYLPLMIEETFVTDYLEKVEEKHKHAPYSRILEQAKKSLKFFFQSYISLEIKNKYLNEFLSNLKPNSNGLTDLKKEVSRFIEDQRDISNVDKDALSKAVCMLMQLVSSHHSLAGKNISHQKLTASLYLLEKAIDDQDLLAVCSEKIIDLIEFSQLNLKGNNQSKIKIFNNQEQGQYEISVKNGLFYDKNGKLVDTSQYQVRERKGFALFVVSSSGKLYGVPEELEEGLMAKHLSMGSYLTIAAGSISIIEGKLECICNDSGHFKPSDNSFNKFMKILKDAGLNYEFLYFAFSAEKEAEYLNNDWYLSEFLVKLSSSHSGENDVANGAKPKISKVQKIQAIVNGSLLLFDQYMVIPVERKRSSLCNFDGYVIEKAKDNAKPPLFILGSLVQYFKGKLRELLNEIIRLLNNIAGKITNPPFRLFYQANCSNGEIFFEKLPDFFVLYFLNKIFKNNINDSSFIKLKDKYIKLIDEIASYLGDELFTDVMKDLFDIINSFQTFSLRSSDNSLSEEYKFLSEMKKTIDSFIKKINKTRATIECPEIKPVEQSRPSVGSP